MNDVDYGKLHLGPGQREAVEVMTIQIASRAALDPIPLKGFFWQSLKRWQRENRRLAKDIPSMHRRERIGAMMEIFRNFDIAVGMSLMVEEEREVFAKASRRVFQDWLKRHSWVQDPDDTNF